mgnify:CR=1 FL=1
MTEVFIEISKGTNIKYEYEDGKLTVDRFLNVPFAYPFNYGYIPNTLGGDGDALDAVVICDYSLQPCSYIKCKLIGCLRTEDESGEDDKFIFIPDETVDKSSTTINNLSDIKSDILIKIKYFFEHYKDLDDNKWIKVNDFIDVENSISLIETGKELFSQNLFIQTVL